MLSTSLVVAGLSSGHKIGLATVGGVFILFALVSSFVLPRRNPNFPGRGVGWYVSPLRYRVGSVSVAGGAAAAAPARSTQPASAFIRRSPRTRR